NGWKPEARKAAPSNPNRGLNAVSSILALADLRSTLATHFKVRLIRFFGIRGSPYIRVITRQSWRLQSRRAAIRLSDIYGRSHTESATYVSGYSAPGRKRPKCIRVSPRTLRR